MHLISGTQVNNINNKLNQLRIPQRYSTAISLDLLLVLGRIASVLVTLWELGREGGMTPALPRLATSTIVGIKVRVILRLVIRGRVVAAKGASSEGAATARAANHTLVML